MDADRDTPRAADLRVNVAAWEERSVVNGPGERFVLWVQGCPFRCPGCINPDFLPFVEARLESVEELAARVLRVPGIEGVTFSGGEPMAQARSLAALCDILRPAGLSIVSYTGYTLEELQAGRKPWIRRFLERVDLLIDGRFEPAAATGLPWRGSANQRVHFLTGRYRHLESEMVRPGRRVELIVGRDKFVTTGNFEAALLRRLEEFLRREEPSDDLSTLPEPR